MHVVCTRMGWWKLVDEVAVGVAVWRKHMSRKAAAVAAAPGKQDASWVGIFGQTPSILAENATAIQTGVVRIAGVLWVDGSPYRGNASPKSGRKVVKR